MSEEPPDHPTDQDLAAGSEPDPGDPDAVDDPFAELSEAGADLSVDDPFAGVDASGTDSDTDAAENADVSDPNDISPVTEGSAAVSEGDSFTELDVPDADPEEDFFREMETADLDEEAVWKSVFEEPATVEPDSEEREGADAVVRKEQYCKKCEHFSEPPELACGNPDTEIVEVVGVEEFQVRNCPVVAARQRADTVFPDEG